MAADYRTGFAKVFPWLDNQVSMLLTDVRASDLGMAKPQDKIRIEVVPVDDGRPAHERKKAVNNALVELARLIGRQIAREQFAQRIALEREAAERMRGRAAQEDE